MRLTVDHPLAPGEYPLEVFRIEEEGLWHVRVASGFLGETPVWVGQPRTPVKSKAPRARVTPPAVEAEDDRSRVETFLQEYEGTENTFLANCRKALEEGSLSDGQVAAIARNNLP